MVSGNGRISFMKFGEVWPFKLPPMRIANLRYNGEAVEVPLSPPLREWRIRLVGMQFTDWHGKTTDIIYTHDSEKELDKMKGVDALIDSGTVHNIFPSSFIKKLHRSFTSITQRVLDKVSSAASRKLVDPEPPEELIPIRWVDGTATTTFIFTHNMAPTPGNVSENDLIKTAVYSSNFLKFPGSVVPRNKDAYYSSLMSREVELASDPPIIFGLVSILSNLFRLGVYSLTTPDSRSFTLTILNSI
ncbi:hypothetical protein K474DRAFT_1666931 [Panus rudis PR-1116 ss-1]|nr:hypothetical protein K474DRAFT_1666931 [Panus rudis PR-1116 ss-1]